jgi:FdhE protein
LVQRLLQPGEIETLDHNAIIRLHLPQPAALFTARATRLRALAANSIEAIPVEPGYQGYLLAMAALVDAQARVTAQRLPAGVTLPDDQLMQHAHNHNMPPVPANGERPQEWRAVFAALLDQLESVPDVRAQMAPALAHLRSLGTADLEGIADLILDAATDGIDTLAAPFIAAALQVCWTIMAAQLDVSWAAPLITGTLCPVCGSHPVASVIRIGGQSQGYRYLHCSLCASEWHMVRVKCSTCETNDKIHYQAITDFDAPEPGKDIDPDTHGQSRINKLSDPTKMARAETCDNCHTYRKIFNQEHDYHIDPLADDLASLTLDMLVSEAGYARASGNPLLWLAAEA